MLRLTLFLDSQEEFLYTPSPKKRVLIKWAEVKNTGSSPVPSNDTVRFWVTGPGWSGTHWVG